MRRYILRVTSDGDPIFEAVWEDGVATFLAQEPLINPSIHRWQTEGLWEWVDVPESPRFRNTNIQDPEFIPRLANYLRMYGYDVQCDPDVSS